MSKQYKNYFKRKNGDVFCFYTDDMEDAGHYDGYLSTLSLAIDDYNEAIDNRYEYHGTHVISGGFAHGAKNEYYWFDMEGFLKIEEDNDIAEAQAEREHEASYHPCYRN